MVHPPPWCVSDLAFGKMTADGGFFFSTSREVIFFFFFFTALRSHGAAYVVDSRVVGLGVGKIRNCRGSTPRRKGPNVLLV